MQLGWNSLLLVLLLVIGAEREGMAQRVDDLAAFSDEFNDPAGLTEWSLHHAVEGWSDKLKVLDVNHTRPGGLYLEPWPSVWYYDYTAPFLFREVRGDFLVSARIRVTGTRSQYPQTLYSLAGLMVRQARPEAPFASEAEWTKNEEDYLFLVTGTTDKPGKPYIETKSVIRSKPLIRHYPINAAGWVELRVARIGRTFLFLYRLVGEEWNVHQRVDRPDLATRLQVGIMAYGDFGTIRDRYWYKPWEYNTSVIRDGDEDLSVEVDWIRFRRAALSDAAARFAAERHLTWDDHRVTNEHLVELMPFLVEPASAWSAAAGR